VDTFVEFGVDEVDVHADFFQLVEGHAFFDTLCEFIMFGMQQALQVFSRQFGAIWVHMLYGVRMVPLSSCSNNRAFTLTDEPFCLIMFNVMLHRFASAMVKFLRKPLQKKAVREVMGVNLDTLEYNFERIERSVRRGGVGFGNPDSKLTPLQQFHLWKRMIQEDTFQTRDEYCNMMATYSSFEQAQLHLDSLYRARQVQLL